MTVGSQASTATINSSITDLSVSMRNIMQKCINLSIQINGQGGGQASLEAIGYSAEDATTALAAISYLNTVAQVYFGSASQPTDFDFNQELSQYWAGQ